MQFTVSVADALGENWAVDYQTQNGTATAGEDYEEKSGTVNFGHTSLERTISIRTLRDNVRDEAETFRVRLSNARTTTANLPSRTLRFLDDVATGTIIDNNAIATEFKNAPSSHNQNTFTLELHLTAPLDADATEVAAAITVDGATVEAENQSPLVWKVTITPTKAGNLTIDLDHTALTGTGERSVAPANPVTVYGRSTASIADAQATESSRQIRFTVRLDKPLSRQATLGWYTTDGTAFNGRDFEGGTGTLTFQPGQTRRTLTLKVFPTTESEDDETFTVTLRNPTGRLIVHPDNGTATGTIKDNSVGVEIQQPATAPHRRQRILGAHPLSPIHVRSQGCRRPESHQNHQPRL